MSLHIGDRLLEVNGMPVKDQPLETIESLLRSPDSTLQVDCLIILIPNHQLIPLFFSLSSSWPSNMNRKRQCRVQDVRVRRLWVFCAVVPISYRKNWRPHSRAIKSLATRNGLNACSNWPPSAVLVSGSATRVASVRGLHRCRGCSTIRIVIRTCQSTPTSSITDCITTRTEIEMTATTNANCLERNPSASSRTNGRVSIRRKYFEPPT